MSASARSVGNAERTTDSMNQTLRFTAGDARYALKGLSLSLLLAFGSSAYALPTSGVVSAGSASISSGSGTMTINQSSQNAAINWQSFSIGQAEAVRFVQPNSNSVALNRVLGSDPSSILGSLSANGKVFLVNPNGILFGKGAQVNVGGLVASTRGITDGDFMAGNYRFAGSSGATVANQGSITADGGYVALLGANVSNEGVISARLGTIALAAGNAMTLDVAGDGLLNVVVNQGAVNALVQNGGLIRADGGQILLTAQSAGNLLQSAVNNTGVIQAQTVENRNGVIRLLGDMQSGTVSAGGTLDASGAGAGQTGGSVTVTGHHVGLFDGHINASGDAGGGTVLVGGGFQGNNPAVQNASATYTSADSTINVDAITTGNGGTAVVWANDSTRAYGSITARGGAQGGNGGLIETSGHWLDVWGIGINASAPNGKAGTWLLDPADVTITAGTTDATLTAGVFSPNSGVNSATIDRDALQVILGVGGAGTDVTITTTNTGAAGNGAGNITVASAISWSPTTSTTLTLNAAGDVNINARITAVGGNLVVCCGQDINVNARITTTNGSVLLSAGRDIRIERFLVNPRAGFSTIDADIRTTDGNISLCAGRDLILSNTADAAPLMTLVTGSVTIGQSLAPLGVTRGLTLSAGNAATGPGAAGGTVLISPGTLISTTGPAPITPTNIFYNPSSYTTPTDYSLSFIGNGSPLTQFMLVFPEVAAKTFDGTTTATFTGLKGSPAGVTLNGTGPAFFDTATAGANKLVNFNVNDFSLSQGVIDPGGAGLNFALPAGCCGVTTRTTGDITAATTTSPTGTLPTMPILPVLYPYTVLAGLNLDVGGITMPPIVVAEIPPVEAAPALSGFVENPVVIPPPVYVPPVRPLRRDRN